MKKVLIVVGDATETVDTLYPYYRLIEAGFQPIVGPRRRTSAEWTRPRRRTISRRLTRRDFESLAANVHCRTPVHRV